MKSPSKIVLLFFSMLVILAACQDDDKSNNPTAVSDQEVISKYLNIDLANLFNYSNPTLPNYYNVAVDNTPSSNAITDMGATLGRVLFYDKNLSVNNTIACASCHQQNLGFTDNATLSSGFENGLTGAHSMRLGNIRYYAGDSMFWDKRAVSVEDQSTRPIQDATEMGFDSNHGGFTALTDKMSGLNYYPILFKRTFSDSIITEERVQLALAQFLRSIVSVNSKFDEGFTAAFNPNAPGGGIGGPFNNFTAEENQGKGLFLQPIAQGGAGCAGCHQPPTFSLDPASKSNGLTMGETTIFKSPSLKNIGVSGPYMHDGSITDLPGVIEHYNTGVMRGPALDPRLNPAGMPQRLNLTQAQKDALVAFLQTLTDTDLNTDPKFSDPFI